MPDLLLSVSAAPVAVEAKLLTKSEKQEQFEQWAKRLTDHIFQKTLPLQTFQPILIVVMKDSDTLPELQAVAAIVCQGPQRFSGTTIRYRSSLFKVILDPPTFPREVKS